MYSQNEIDEAVSAGAISAEAAQALRAHVAGQRHQPVVDEEQFRLLTGFNDIFVSIASVILLVAIAWIGHSLGTALGLTLPETGYSLLSGASVAATAWGLALFFTAKRRMALPSILLLLAFVGGIFATALFTLVLAVGEAYVESHTAIAGLIGSLAAAVAALAAWAHWRRFKVPITVAAGAAACVAVAMALLLSALGSDEGGNSTLLLAFLLLLGIGVFLFAMRWDGSDRQRQTRRADVAFWLHLLAAPMIVHPVFTLLGLNDGDASVLEGLVVILLYIVIGIAALAIDRRALLVSALAYVLWALSELFERFGAVELNIALTALVIGSALLLLSAFWHQARVAVVERLPSRLQDRLPVAQ